MLVLHGGISPGRLLIWAEEYRDSGSPSRGGRRHGRRRKSRVHPFAAPAERVAEGLAALGGTAETWLGQRVQAFAWLPSSGGTPLPSSPLVGAPSGRGDDPRIRAWRVDAVSLTLEQVLDVLFQAVGRRLARPGVALAADTAWCGELLRLAGVLLARQHFLPGIEHKGRNWYARWEPVLAGADRAAFENLVETMPESARALTLQPDAPPEGSRPDAARAFLSDIVDFIARFAPSPEPPSGWSPERRNRRPAGSASLHDRWLGSLHSYDGLIPGDPRDLEPFARQVREWRRPLARLTESPLRLCLKLEEPSEAEGRSAAWVLRFLLQPVKDPAVFIPAREAWKKAGTAKAALEGYGVDPREILLASLGAAARVFPPIEASLHEKAPEACRLSYENAYDFLSGKALALEEAGFGVLTPAWWNGGGARERPALRAFVETPPDIRKGGVSLDSTLEFRWEIALGEDTLTLEELRNLASLKHPLVRLRGRWVAVNPDHVKTLILQWKKNEKGTATLRDIVGMALGAYSDSGGIEVAGVRATGWLEELLARLENRASYEAVETPRDFHGHLRPYQLRGLSWLAFLGRWGLGACLADDMGLGKTIQTLAFLLHRRSLGESDPVLLICPTSVVGNWHKEASRFAPGLPVLVHHGAARLRGADFAEQARRYTLVVTSYSLLYRDIESFMQVQWAGAIMDEAQNIKNAETRQAKAARLIPAGYRIALTGTPVENNVGDLWSIMEFLNPGLLGTQADFKRRFFIPIQAGRSAAAVAKLRRLGGPFILRRLKTDPLVVADLPDKLETKVYCTLTREQAELYTRVVEESLEEIQAAQGMTRRGIVLATLTRLKQVCNHPAHFLRDEGAINGRSGKLTRLVEMLEEVLEGGERALLFTQFTEMGDILEQHLRDSFGCEVLYLHGSVPKKKREDLIERFQSDGGPPLFLLSLKAGGTGLNLTRANHVFHFDRWWNPAVENQATDRAFRIGQTSRVEVHKFVCIGTLEERIDEMIERKKDVAEQVVSAGEAWITELSDNEIRDLLTLREEALEGEP